MSDQPFTALFKEREAALTAEAQRKADRERLNEAVTLKRRLVTNEWLIRVMGELKIPFEVRGIETFCIVDGFCFQLSFEDSNGPLRSASFMTKSVDDYEERDFKTSVFGLIIINTKLPEEFDQKRPDMHRPFADRQGFVKILSSGHRDWANIRVQVADVILHLTKEAEEASMRKALLEAQEAERIEQERLFAEERAEERRRDAEARKKEQDEREAEEAAYRKEVADKFGVSVGAFNYLIEQLADQLDRRQHNAYDY